MQKLCTEEDLKAGTPRNRRPVTKALAVSCPVVQSATQWGEERRNEALVITTKQLTKATYRKVYFSSKLNVPSWAGTCNGWPHCVHSQGADSKEVGTQCTFFFPFSYDPLSHEMMGLLSSTQSRNNFVDRAEICKRVSIVIPDVTKLKIITGLTINMSVPKSQIQNQGHEVCRMNFCCCGDGGNLLSTNSADQIITSGSLWSLRQALRKEVHHGSLHVS